LSFNFEEQPKWVSAVIGGFALSAYDLIYFNERYIGGTGIRKSTILSFWKGMTIKNYLEAKAFILVTGTFLLWSVLF